MDRFRSLLPAAERHGQTVLRLLKPGIDMWPWLFADAGFVLYLVLSSQGRSVVSELASLSPALSAIVFAVSVSFVLTFAACLVTALVLAIRREVSGSKPTDVQRDGRAAGAIVIGWALILAACPGIALWLLTGRARLLLVVLLTAMASVGVLTLALRGAWQQPNTWHERLKHLHRYRYVLAATVFGLSACVLALGAAEVRDAPLSPQALGPVFVPLLGLIANATLFGALLVALPHASRHPWFVRLCVAALLAFNLAQLPLVDAENPLLKRHSPPASAAEVGAKEPPCKSNFNSERHALLDRVRAPAPPTLPAMPASAPRPPMLLVSSEGGGIRAAYWTAVGLASLDLATDGAFGQNVASLSGVSGGSLGIATWLAARETPHLNWEERTRLVSDFLSSDFLSPQLSGLFFLDAPRLVFGHLWSKVRRDDVFEAALIEQWRKFKGGDLFLNPLSKLCLRSFESPPLVVFNATEALSGMKASLLSTQVGLPWGIHEYFNSLLRDTDLKIITVGKAVVMSARFPFLSPAANIGIQTTALASAMRSSTRRWGAEVDGPPPSIGSRMESLPEGVPERVRMGVLVDGGYVDNTGLSWTRRLIATIERDKVVSQTSEKMGRRNEKLVWLDDVSVRVLHFSNDPSGACRDPGDWTSKVPNKIRALVRKTGYRPICSTELDELAAIVDPQPFQWLATPLETIIFTRRGHALREEREVVELVARRQGDNSYFDFSLADALSSELCRLRREPEAAVCERYRARRLRVDFSPTPSNGLAALQAAGLVVAGRLAQQRADCLVAADQAQLPLGWVLPRDDAKLMRCLAAQIVPVALQLPANVEAAR